MIVGEDKPDSGALSIGSTVELAWVEQSRDALDRMRRCSTRSREGWNGSSSAAGELHARA